MRSVNLQFINKIYNEEEGGILMRFIHMADVHFDSPFTVLASRENLANERRLEQMKAFADAIEYIKENQIPFLFISGDLYEQKYIRKSTIEYINNLVKEIPNTQIFITPGNHDPFLVNSFYNTFKWNDNVTIFDSEIKIVETEEADIYGFGFTDFYCENSQIEKINIKNKNKINILIAHGSLDASKTLDMQYNPLNSNKLKEIGFDYAALGHIHKANFEENKNNFIYPGSLISFGFDELGEHGFLDVEINKNNSEINNLINLKINNNNLNNSGINKNNFKINKKIKFIKADKRVFEEIKLNISEINSEEELIEEIKNIKTDKQKNYKVIFEGYKNTEINLNKIQKMVLNETILKVKDFSKMKYDINELANQNNLKGVFINRILQKEQEGICTKEEMEEAIEIFINALK